MRAVRRLSLGVTVLAVLSAMATPVALAAPLYPRTVVITSPAADAVAKTSPLIVHATGSVDLSDTGKPASMQLWVDGLKYGLPWACKDPVTTAKTCVGTFKIYTVAMAGRHTMQVTMTADDDMVTPSAAQPFYAYSKVKLSLNPVATVAAGKLGIIRGVATTVTDKKPLAHVKISLTLAPAFGSKHVVTVMTGATGHFSIATKIVANTAIGAKIAATRSTGLGAATTTAHATAPVSCKVDPTVRYQAYDSGMCTVPHLPAHTKVALQYQSNKKWHTLVAGTVNSSPIPISFTFGRRGTYPMRLVVSANKVYVTTYGKPFTVRVI